MLKLLVRDPWCCLTFAKCVTFSDHSATEQMERECDHLQQRGEGMSLRAAEAPAGREHLLSHPDKLGLSVKANETGFCVPTSCCPWRT